MNESTNQNHSVCLECSAHPDVTQNLINMTKSAIKSIVPAEWL